MCLEPKDLSHRCGIDYRAHLKDRALALPHSLRLRVPLLSALLGLALTPASADQVTRKRVLSVVFAISRLAVCRAIASFSILCPRHFGALHGPLLSSVCVPVHKVETDLLQPVRGHADGMKYVFILNTIYPYFVLQNA